MQVFQNRRRAALDLTVVILISVVLLGALRRMRVAVPQRDPRSRDGTLVR